MALLPPPFGALSMILASISLVFVAPAIPVIIESVFGRKKTMSITVSGLVASSEQRSVFGLANSRPQIRVMVKPLEKENV